MNLLQFKGAVIGTVMGDGCLREHGHLECSSISKEYLDWKKEFLEQLTEVKIREDTKINGWNKKPLFILRTMAHPIYKKLRLRMYHLGKKTIDEYCLKTLNPLGILWWYLDDGTLQLDNRGNSKGLGINWTTNFTQVEYLFIQKYLNDKFGLRTNIHQNFKKERNEKYSELYLKAVDRLRFYDNIIAPYLDKIPENLKYKIPKRETIIELLNNPHNHKGSLEVYKKDIVWTSQKCDELSGNDLTK